MVEWRELILVIFLYVFVFKVGSAITVNIAVLHLRAVTIWLFGFLGVGEVFGIYDYKERVVDWYNEI
jgi:hypothetical protein